MPAPLNVRTFHREDRDQLTDLVNAHVAAVVPGAGVSVNTVLSSLERQPDEFVLDPWVAERTTLVVEHRHRIVAAAHLLRYRDDLDTGDDYRDTGHVQWSLHLPADPDQDTPDEGAAAADLLLSACLAQLDRWQVRARHADGQLPSPGVYGVPAPWPHVRAALERAGFVHTGHTEILLLARLVDLPAPRSAVPVPGLTVHRTLGPLGTRLTARVGTEELAHVELDTSLDRPERHARTGGTADLADFALAPDAHPELFPWLLGRARAWLELCGTERVTACATPDEEEDLALLGAVGFQELTRTARGWEHRPG
ncbi:N-acetyltransferase [Streptomyces sp. NPDC002490]|uniref:N-acetyltransferase n=1 Tax=Streptomyces sp. NPDC002490 TaxID=3154416 RepID=UPI00332C1C4B